MADVISSVNIADPLAGSPVVSDPIAVQAGDVVVVSVGMTYADNPTAISVSDNVHGSYGSPVVQGSSPYDHCAIWAMVAASTGNVEVTLSVSGEIYGSICEVTVLRGVNPTPAGTAAGGAFNSNAIGPAVISSLSSGDYLTIGVAQISDASSPTITPDGSQTSLRTRQVFGIDAGDVSYREQNGVTSTSLQWTGTGVSGGGWNNYAAVAFAVAGGGGAVEGELDVTLAGATASASGTLAIAGAAAVSLGAASVSASGALPITGGASLTAAASTLSASGTLPLLAEASLTLAAASLSASGAFSTAPIITSVIGDPGGLGIVTRGGLVALAGINL